MAAAGSGHGRERNRNQGVYKSGHLFISSKGLGWKSWKRRWFLLTRTSLVFFKNEPRGPIDGSLALGGIDLNSSGSVHVKADKRLLSLLFPDGRAFTLKADAAEELEDWRQALEQALAAAPSASLLGGDVWESAPRNDSAEASGLDPLEAGTLSRKALKSLVIGRPILLALEDIDGSPSFLEKALRYLETYGVNSEGILRESADVEAVETRVRDYEQGKDEFGEDENAHVIGDCVKHVLRELPSSPVPVPCCTALLLASRTQDIEGRKEALKAAIFDTFPDPNRRLLQRILQMMRAIAKHADVNRMSASAVSACMAPLLLRPLVSGECLPKKEEVEELLVDADDSLQILEATQAANQAQLISSFLMEHYTEIFPEDLQDRPLVARFFGSDLSWGADEDDVGGEAEDELENEDSVQTKVGDSTSETSEVVPPGFASERADEPSPRLKSGATPSKFPRIENASVDRPQLDTARSSGISSKGVSLKGVLSFWDRGGPGESSKLAPLEDRGDGVQVLPSGLSERSSPRLAETPWSSAAPSELPSPRLPSASDEEQKLGVAEAVQPASISEETQTQALELTKHDLRSSIARESRANAVLRDTLTDRKLTLAEQRHMLEQNVAKLQEQLALEKEAASVSEKVPRAVQNDLDPQLQAELEEIGTIEHDVVGLQHQKAALQRQLERVQDMQRRPPTVASSSERRQKIESLLSMKVQLQKELERTMTLCLKEQRKNVELEEKRRREDPAVLEQAVAQQRSILTEAQVALQAEMARGKELRRRMQAAQRSGMGISRDDSFPTATVSLIASSGPLPMGSGASYSLGASGGQAALLGVSGVMLKDPPPPVALHAEDSSQKHSGENGSEGSPGGHRGTGKPPGSSDREEDQAVLDANGGTAVPSNLSHERQLSTAAMVEVSSRLEHFKERRSQLMRQLAAFTSDFPVPPTDAPS